MASNPDLVQYIADQCADAGQITYRKMFGDYALYCDSLLIGLICDNRLYLKPNPAALALIADPDLQPPYPGAKPHIHIADLDNRQHLAALARATRDHLLQQPPKPTRPKASKASQPKTPKTARP